jgi:D-alanyl-D-alanine carboxypeptidase (penicillin-binding protein 5/6)
MNRNTLLVVVALLVLVAILPYKIQKPKNPTQAVSGAVVSSATETPAEKADLPKFVGVETNPVLSAKAVLAIDLGSKKVLYSQNEHEKLPIASLTKLMTAMVVLDHMNKDKVATIQKGDISTVCACMGLLEGENITIENLLKGMLIPSNNDAAQALARTVGGTQDAFVGMMNDNAKNLGLTDTHFSTPVGFDVPENYSTAADLSVIAQEFLKYSLLEKIVATGGEDVTSTDGKFVHHLKTSNKLLLEDSEVVGVKTGFTTDAQGNLILKIDHSGELVLTVVLNTPDREQDTKNLIDWIFRSYSWE